MEELRSIKRQELQEDIYEEAISDPEGFADVVLRKTDPEDTLEQIGINRGLDSIFRRVGLDYNGLSTGVLREYPEEVAKRANVSLDDVVRYFEEMDEDVQSYLASKGYDRLVDYDPNLAKKLDEVSVGIARDKLLDGGIDDVERIVGNSRAVDEKSFQLWKVLERKRRQKVQDDIEENLGVGAIDDEMAEDFRKRLGEIEPGQIFLDYVWEG
jgi:hypothetical protein